MLVVVRLEVVGVVLVFVLTVLAGVFVSRRIGVVAMLMLVRVAVLVGVFVTMLHTVMRMFVGVRMLVRVFVIVRVLLLVGHGSPQFSVRLVVPVKLQSAIAPWLCEERSTRSTV